MDPFSARHLRRPRPLARVGADAVLLCPTYHRGREVLDRRRADLLHDKAQLEAEQLEHALDAGLAERTQAPDIRPADAYALSTERERLRNIGAAAKTAVNQDRHPAAYRLDDFGEGVNGRAPAILAAPAVI